MQIALKEKGHENGWRLTAFNSQSSKILNTEEYHCLSEGENS